MDVRFFDVSVEKFVNALEQEAFAKVLRTVTILGKCGNKIAMPWSKPLHSGIFELRIRGKQEVRLLYVFHNGVAVLLHGFIKKTFFVPRNEILVALKKKASLDSI